VEAFWSPALASLRKSAGKSRWYCNSVNYRLQAGEDLSLSGGASNVFLVFRSEHHLSYVASIAFKTTKATLSGRPRKQAAIPPQD
jgi:hypothetical protein